MEFSFHSARMHPTIIVTPRPEVPKRFKTNSTTGLCMNLEQRIFHLRGIQQCVQNIRSHLNKSNMPPSSKNQETNTKLQVLDSEASSLH